ncbi:hypothetical protein CF134_11035 [Aeromonas salmonicida]|nr:hypothetical protein CF134_11035 [Aeromonas salmonicida]
MVTIVGESVFKSSYLVEKALFLSVLSTLCVI